MTFGAEAFWLRTLLFRADWSNRLLDRVIQASVVGVAFWGIAITLLIGMDAKSLIVRLKRVGYYKLLVSYLGESLFACFVILLLSVVLEPLNGVIKPIILSSLWFGAGAWAAATTFRTFIILIRLLSQAADEIA